MADEPSRPLRLTKLGELANAHGVMTPPQFWRDLFNEIDRVAERDGEWELLIDERIRGLQAMRDGYYEIADEVHRSDDEG